MKWQKWSEGTWKLTGVNANLADCTVFDQTAPYREEGTHCDEPWGIIINCFGIDNECKTLEEAQRAALRELIEMAEIVIEDAKKLLGEDNGKTDGE